MSDYSIRPAELLASEVISTYSEEELGAHRTYRPGPVPVRCVHATRYEIADTLEEMVRMKRRNYRPDCLCLACRVTGLVAALRESTLDGATDPTYEED